MTAREDTVQQLDPLGGVVARPLVLLTAAGLLIWSVSMQVIQWDEVTAPVPAIAGLVLLVAALALIVYASSPLRGPLSLTVSLSAVGTTLVASTVSALGSWEGNAVIRDDWGPTAIGVVLMVLAPFRPPRELATAGAFTALFAGFVALMQTPVIGDGAPPIVHVIVAVTPILILSFGGAAFADVLVRVLHRWKRRASAAVQEFSDEQLLGLTRSVQQERVTILNRDVVPFFAEVLDRADVLDGDRERASEIADSIRRVMVAEVDRSWLDLVVDRAAADLGYDHGSESIQDPEQLAPAMSTDQRTAVRAAIVAVFAHPSFDPDGFDIVFTRRGDRCEGTVRANFATDSSVRSTLAPYFAVLRVVFIDLAVDFASPTLIVRFSYDRN